MGSQSSAIRHDTNADVKPGSPVRATVEDSERSNIEDPVTCYRKSFWVKEGESEW